MTGVVERFINYAKIDTMSNEDSTTVPSTSKQLIFAEKLVNELKSLGLKNISNEKGYVFGTLPSNTDKNIPVIGFMAHIDTSPDMSSENVNPKIIENYNGDDIVLNVEKNIVMKTKDFPELKKYKGETLITTDGTTLLGADDKAGIAEIMSAVEYLINNPHIKHGYVRVAFTPDEEIGRGPENFNVENFNADFAYTVDGGAIGELEYENFNAAGAKIVINGRNVHPGYAKDKMINSLLIASELNSMLPKNEIPSLTENYEGFYHLSSVNGDIECTKMSYIIRDFDINHFQDRKSFLNNIIDTLNKKYGDGTITLKIKDQYYNMKEKIQPVMHIVDTAFEAMTSVGVKPIVRPIRGGTDGAQLSFKGLPTPNLFTGGENFHGKYEYIPVFALEKATDVIIKIIELYSNK